MNEVIQTILKNKVIAIVRGISSESIVDLAGAFQRGGIGAVEVTFNQKDPDSWPDTARAIRRISEAFPDTIIAGAGTVLTEEQVEIAAEAGAKYIISPHCDARVIRRTKALNLVSMPGALTPTEIVFAADTGADFVKVFPAGTLGVAYIKAIKAPISHIRLMAVGGVNEKNAADFLRAGCVGVGVGGNLVNKEWIESGAFDRIEALAREYAQVVKEG